MSDGIVSWINQRRRYVLAALGLLVLAALLFSIRGVRSQSTGGQPDTQAFYSTDDGKTWFVDSITREPPFDHEGSPAYRVVMMACNCNGKRTVFPAYLQRFVKRANGETGTEVKRAGDPRAAWGNTDDVLGKITCSHGGSRYEAVTP